MSAREKVGILLDLDGEQLDLSQIAWQEIAACGCVCGLTSATMGERLVITPADAAKSFSRSKAEQGKYAKLGFTWRAREIGRAHEEFRVECPHEPKYGVPPRPQPEGMEWAVGGYFSDATRVQHLVPVASVETDDLKPERDAWRATALCGVEKSHWSSRWHRTDGKVECARCLRKATAEAGAE